MLKRSSLAVAAATAVIIIAGSLGRTRMNNALRIEAQREIALFPGFHITMHRIGHFALFGLLSWSLCLACATTRRRISWSIATMLFAAAIEILQYLLYPNPFESSDLRDDILAILTAFAMAQLWRLYRTEQP